MGKGNEMPSGQSVESHSVKDMQEAQLDGDPAEQSTTHDLVDKPDFDRETAEKSTEELTDKPLVEAADRTTAEVAGDALANADASDKGKDGPGPPGPPDEPLEHVAGSSVAHKPPDD